MTAKTTSYTALAFLATLGLFSFSITREGVQLPALVKAESRFVRTAGGTAFRDLNKNGKMDVYEDAKQPVEKRVQDLLKQMTLEDKAGMMFYAPVLVNSDGSLEEKPATDLLAKISTVGTREIDEHHLTHFNLFGVATPDSLAIWYNNLQRYAEKAHLGIPITISTDPRNQAQGGFFAMSALKTFSEWPAPLGLAAIGDEKITEQFANISRQEYMAVGIRQCLHPQVDLATEPRWPRITGTFGEDAALSSRMVTAYIKGYQGAKLGPNSVATMTKHWPGGGPQKDGLDPHFKFQKGQVYPGNNFKYHLLPFEAAFKAGTAAIMPYYGVAMGLPGIEEVGFSYNKSIITDLLRKQYHFDGVVCTDWGIVTSNNKLGKISESNPARAWGVENLSTEQRVQKIIDAGVDQMGGEHIPEVVVALVKQKKVTETRLNETVVRLLRLKFELGLFDNPFVDAKMAGKTVGRADFMKAGEDAQRRSMTLLKNEAHLLPLKPNTLKIYVKNIDPELAAKYGTVVEDPKKADIAIIRLETPTYPIPEAKGNLIATFFHFGDMDFKGVKLQEVLDLEKTVPTVVDIFMDRPAVIPEISQGAKALLVNYGSNGGAVLDVVFGKAKPGGHLPFELPSSMEAAHNQKEDVPFDSKDPLYKYGAGLSY